MNSIKEINLTKLKKCNQIWDKMPENEKGRLCQKCHNTIIDFRNLSNSEIAITHAFSKEKVCGLYSKKQLAFPKKKGSFVKLNSWGSLYIWFLGFLSVNDSYASELNRTFKVEQTDRKDKKIDIINNRQVSQNKIPVNDKIIISGILTDDTGLPLPGVNVIIRGTTIGTQSDFDGFYKIDVTEPLKENNTVTLIYHYVGFSTSEITIDKNDFKEKSDMIINHQFNPDNNLIAFYITVEPIHKKVWRFPKKAWKGIKRIFQSNR